MLGEFVDIGDKVLIDIPQESRDWGYNPAANGTIGVIVGFSTIDYGRIGNYGHKPGIYHNRSWPKIELPTGEVIYISACHLAPFDKTKYDRKAKQSLRTLDKNDDFINVLPETKFWEHDEVKPISQRAIEHLSRYDRIFVVRIDYGRIDEKVNDGSPWPIYDVSSDIHGGWYTSFREDDFELVKRGNVWNYYHNLPLNFGSLKEKANFYQVIGRTKEVRNPANKLYSWTLEEALQAIQDGIAHSINVAHGLFGGGPSTRVEWFLDEEVGKEVAKATLEGFGIPQK